MSPKILLVGILFPIMLLLCGCSLLFNGKEAQRKEAILQTQKQILTNPKDMEAVRELGILYYQGKEYARAEALLSNVMASDSMDLRSKAYLGLLFEETDRETQALRLYRASVNRESTPYTDWLTGRFQRLRRQLAPSQLKRTLLEQADEPANLSRTKVVVPAVTYHGKDKKYSTMAVGITALLHNALEHVENISIVDFYMVQVASKMLEDEPVENQTSNPYLRLGRLFESGTVIKCNFNVVDDRQIVFDVAFWNLLEEELPETRTYSAPMNGGLANVREDLLADFSDYMSVPIPRNVHFAGRIDPEAFMQFSQGIVSYMKTDYNKAETLFRKSQQEPNGLPLFAQYLHNNILMQRAGFTPDQLGLPLDNRVLETGIQPQRSQNLQP